ncbi:MULTISPECIES: TRAP transporter substrate-binding protein [unclassified Marinobacterium]|uniref:TRAP transporter substrate-binding protein n=1 Tax=unclassified Marinobacterium TaxID=2644139 RepID=UPI0015681F94|nr:MULTISPECIES: TRAP transporter substrate-binding protein [unclassified Marinobacterium]NRP52973.1 Bacterial extracellular solute-binding protein, family 7 [Marinobacterium sp. xm-v-242]NRP77554.1 Bacterial extracellular solute-binding protein, family 7 [Marinobacterium sp. xm-m-383]
MTIKTNIMGTLTAATMIGSLSFNAQAETLTMSNWVPPAHFVSGILKDWAEDVSEATEGRVTVRMLPKAVGSPPQHWELARKGVADITWGNWTYEPERFKAVWFSEVPFIGDSAEASSLALWDTYKTHLEANTAFDGVKVLGVGTLGPGVINHGSKDIVTPADLANQKVRMGGPIQKVLIETVGAIPVAAPATKAYEMLNGGVIDASLHPMESVVNFRLDGVLTHHTKIPEGFYDASFFLAMNEKRWNKLSKADKKAIETVSGAAFAKLWGGTFDAQSKAAEEKMRASGEHSFSEPSPELMALITEAREKIINEWASDASNFGIDNPMEIVNYHKERYNAHANK